MAELQQRIVNPFPCSRTRSPLHSSLELFLGSLSRTGLIYEPLVYGSILTSEQNPDRIGLIIPFEMQSYEDLSEHGLTVVENLFDPYVALYRFGIEIQPVDRSVEQGIRRKLSQFATEQDGITPSRIVLLRLKP
jgi:hypothetical protein